MPNSDIPKTADSPPDTTPVKRPGRVRSLGDALADGGVKGFVLAFLLMVVTGLVSPAGHIEFDFARHWQAIAALVLVWTAVGAIVRSVSSVAASRATLDEAHWYHMIVAMMLPYVAVVWGIVNLSRGKYRSGHMLLVIPLVLLAFTTATIVVITCVNHVGPAR